MDPSSRMKCTAMDALLGPKERHGVISTVLERAARCKVVVGGASLEEKDERDPLQ
jgi:hypothetical protein